ncbi:MAG: DUF6491 family protein [Pseudomonadales bacterium]
MKHRTSGIHCRRTKRLAACAAAALLGCAALPAAFALTPHAQPDAARPNAEALLARGVEVSRIDDARSTTDFDPLDDQHVLLTTEDDARYLLTLNRECPSLRWARHVGVTTSGDAIWAGFDALTADGQSCQIREIHRL